MRSAWSMLPTLLGGALALSGCMTATHVDDADGGLLAADADGAGGAGGAGGAPEDAGAGGQGGQGGIGANGGEGPAAWTTAEVFTALRPICGACHGAGTSLPSFADLRSFEALIVGDDAWIVPGEPAQSALLDLLGGQGPGFYAQMPLTGPPYLALAEDDAALPDRADLEGWIAALAPAEPPDDPVGPGGAGGAGGEGGAGGGGGERWTTDRVYTALRPICSDCHGRGQSLPFFSNLGNFQALLVEDEAWVVPGAPDESALLDLLGGEGPGEYPQMPPGGNPYFARLANRPELPDRDDLAGWIAGLEGEAPPVEPPPVCWDRPGPLLVGRFNRTQYNHAVQALLGVASTPADDFPSEDNSYGLDNIAESLTVTPLLVEKYDLAAAALAREALPERTGASRLHVLEAEQMTGQVGAASGEIWNLWSNGDLNGELRLEHGGRYTVRARVRGGQAGPDPVRFDVLVDGVALGPFVTRAQAPDFELVVAGAPDLRAGLRTFTIRFLNDYYCPQDRFDAGTCAALGDRNLHIDRLEVEGPAAIDLPPTAFERRYLDGCDLVAPTPDCARGALARLGRLAWRRGLEEAELDDLWGLVEVERDAPGGIRAGLRQAVHALLLSPRFLFRVENDGAPGEPLTGEERAARLAAFLWRSVPDEALLDEAAAGALDTPRQMAAAARRMLADPRGEAMVKDLGEQWLLLRQAAVADPEYALFPDFDEALRDAMIEETRLVWADIWRGDGSLLDVIDADFTYVNERLARHYGMQGVAGDAMQRVELPQANRLGVLTHASWLTATSHRTRTSPVRRGKWVLEELLCAAPPPPPPNVEGLPEDVDQNLPLRERLEQHRANPECAACHVHMDAIGFGFERFDATGAWRLQDAGEPIEPGGVLLGEVPFDDAAGLARAIRNHPDLGPCVLHKLVTYALGRGLAEEEQCLVDAVAIDAAREGYRPEAIIEAIVQSPLFTLRGAVQPAAEEDRP